MAFLLNWFASKPVAPERVPTDTVIPVNRIDDSRTFKAIALEFTMRFDEVLDAEKVSGALWKLLERPGWRKLGARLRLNDKGKLEYHIPAQYTKERPPINYTHVKHDVSFFQHPIGSTFPRPNGTLQVFDGLEALHSLTAPENNTSMLDDWIYADKAQLSLHIVSFPDATLVTLTWLHTLLDAMGRSALLKAWRAMLEGRENDIPEFWGYDFDPLENLGAPYDAKSASADNAPPHEESVLKDKILKGWTLFRFVIGYLWEVFYHSEEVPRLVVIPASYFTDLKKQAYRDLETADPSLLTMSTLDPKNPKPFLSDGDILCAWFLRLTTTANPNTLASSPSRTIQVMNVFGLRDILTNTSPQLIPKGKAYISNAASAIVSLFPLRDVISKPLGHLAAQIRKDLVLQGTRAQVEARQRLDKENGGNSVLFGSGDMALSAFSNWDKAKLYETDFSAAIVKEATVEQGKKHARGKPSYIHAHGTANTGFALRGSGNCVGKDHEGNYLIGTFVRKEFAPDFAKAVEGLR